MKRIITLLVILGFMGLPVFVTPAAAVDVIGPACQNADPANLPAVCRPNPNPSTSNPLFGPDGILTTAVNLLSILAGVIAVFVIIISGAKMITSAGDSNSVKEARNALLYAVISLVIVASAQIIVRFILNKIG